MDHLLKDYYVISSIFMILFSHHAYADLVFEEDNYGKGTATAQDFLVSLSNMIMNGLLAVSFCAGTGLIIWGFVVMANKDNNPQGAQGAWKKVAFGGCLVTLSAILGIIKSTIKNASAAGGGLFGI
ncbi:MAG: hypothetical protein ABFD12_12725 [Syntrophorhabdus sp.]